MSGETRVPPVAPGSRPELAPIEDDIRAERGGELAVLYQVLLNSPPIAAGWEKLLTAVRNRGVLPADLREMVILRVAVLNRAVFEFDAHAPHARAAGVPPEKIEVLREAAPDVGFTDDELLMVELTDHMTRDVEVPETVLARLRERFGDRGTVEAVTTVAAYNMVSRFLVALNIIH